MELDDEEDLGGIRVGAKVNFDGIGGRFESRGDCGGVRGVLVALGLFITSGLSLDPFDVQRGNSLMITTCLQRAKLVQTAISTFHRCLRESHRLRRLEIPLPSRPLPRWHGEGSPAGRRSWCQGVLGREFVCWRGGRIVPAVLLWSGGRPAKE